MKTFKKFEEMLKIDENLALEYNKLIKSNNEESIFSFMKTHGVSDEDIKDLVNRELSDDELDGVAGGVHVRSPFGRNKTVEVDVQDMMF